MSELTKETTIIQSLDDLICLVRGDKVKLIYEYGPNKEFGFQKEVAFHGNHVNGALEFVIPQFYGIEYLSVYRQTARGIEFRGGAIVLNEDKSSSESHRPGDNRHYETYNQTLQMAGLR